MFVHHILVQHNITGRSSPPLDFVNLTPCSKRIQWFYQSPSLVLYCAMLESRQGKIKLIVLKVASRYLRARPILFLYLLKFECTTRSNGWFKLSCRFLRANSNHIGFQKLTAATSSLLCHPEAVRSILQSYSDTSQRQCPRFTDCSNLSF